MSDADAPPPFADWCPNGAVHPSMISRCRAGHVIDEAGREHIDYLSAWGSNILGYGYPAVVDAVRAQLEIGVGYAFAHPLGVELQRLLCEVIPCADEVLFAKNGSDVTAAAVRLARAVTGRERLLVRGYHGIHDWYMAADLGCPGIPSSLRALVDHLPYNDLEGIERLLQKCPLAAIVIDPVTVPLPEPGFLEGMVELAHRHGALVVFDEVGTGFRLAPGGAQQYYGVVPDLACFSKALANGLPLAVLVGRRQYMQHAGALGVGVTAAWEALSMAAARATVTEIRERQVCDELWLKGNRLQRAFEAAARRHEVSSRLAGTAPRAQLEFEDQGGLSELELRWLVIDRLASEGIITTGVFLVCFSHTEDDLDRTAAAFDRALATARQAIDAGSTEGLMNPVLRRSILATLECAPPSAPAPEPAAATPPEAAPRRRRLRTVVRDLLPHGLVRHIQARRSR